MTAVKRKKPLIGKIQPSETLFYGMIAVIGVIVLLTGFYKACRHAL